jgi:hypothetical protein
MKSGPIYSLVQNVEQQYIERGPEVETFVFIALGSSSRSAEISPSRTGSDLTMDADCFSSYPDDAAP